MTAILLYHIFALMVSLGYLSVGAENWSSPTRATWTALSACWRRPGRRSSWASTRCTAGCSTPKLGEVDWSRLKIAIGGGAAVVGAVSDRWKAITGHFIRGLRPVGNLAGGVVQPGPHHRVHRHDRPADAVDRRQAARRQGPEVGWGSRERSASRAAGDARLLGEADANATAFTSDGYFRTGDIGVFDDKGFLKIVDRKKDMIIVSGFNVYPNEVEAVVANCPGAWPRRRASACRMRKPARPSSCSSSACRAPA